MAISLIGNPTFQLIPAFNPIKYYYDSTNKNQQGFRYVVDVYDAGTANKIWEGRGFPLPTTGYLEVDLQPIVSTKVSYEDDTTVNGSNATKSWYRFDLKIGEEYIVAWSYTGYSQYTGGGTWNNYTQLSQSPNVTPHTFVVGDQINVSQTDGGVIKPMLQGLFTVVAVPNAYTVVIDIPWASVGTGAAMGGTIKYADNRKTIVRDLSVRTNQTVYNGALSPNDFITLAAGSFYLSAASTTQRLLTDMPAIGMRSTISQDLFVNVGNNFNLGGTAPAFVYFENDSGDSFRKSLGSSGSTAIRQIGVGANNLGVLTTVTGTAPLIKATTKYYNIWITNSAFAQMTQKYRIEIDRRCVMNTTEVLFLDRLGSLISFAFQAQISESGTVTREAFKRQLGGLSSGAWRYTNREGGTQTTSVSLDKQLVLRSYWLTEAQSVYFEQLVTSPFVLMKYNGIYYRVEVLDTGFTVDRDINGSMIKKQITVRMANQTNINV